VEPAIEKAVDKMANMIGKGFAHNDTWFDAIESCLDRIEHLLLAEQKREIEDLKKRMKRLENALAV
jgi:prefoldin subunit 5